MNISDLVEESNELGTSTHFPSRSRSLISECSSRPLMISEISDYIYNDYRVLLTIKKKPLRFLFSPFDFYKALNNDQRHIMNSILKKYSLDLFKINNEISTSIFFYIYSVLFKNDLIGPSGLVKKTLNQVEHLFGLYKYSSDQLCDILKLIRYTDYDILFYNKVQRDDDSLLKIAESFGYIPSNAVEDSNDDNNDDDYNSMYGFYMNDSENNKNSSKVTNETLLDTINNEVNTYIKKYSGSAKTKKYAKDASDTNGAKDTTGTNEFSKRKRRKVIKNSKNKTRPRKRLIKITVTKSLKR